MSSQAKNDNPEKEFLQIVAQFNATSLEAIETDTKERLEIGADMLIFYDQHVAELVTIHKEHQKCISKLADEITSIQNHRLASKVLSNGFDENWHAQQMGLLKRQLEEANAESDKYENEYFSLTEESTNLENKAKGIEAKILQEKKRIREERAAEEMKRIEEEAERKRQEQADWERKEKEAERKRLEEKEAERKRYEEEEAQHKEEETKRKRKEDVERKRQMEEEAERKREEEAERKRRKEEEAERKQKEKKAERKRKEEQAERKRKEKEAERERQKESRKRRRPDSAEKEKRVEKDQKSVADSSKRGRQQPPVIDPNQTPNKKEPNTPGRSFPKTPYKKMVVADSPIRPPSSSASTPGRESPIRRQPPLPDRNVVKATPSPMMPPPSVRFVNTTPKTGHQNAAAAAVKKPIPMDLNKTMETDQDDDSFWSDGD